MKQEKNYNIGLDIGVGSIGWCVTDDENNILKKESKNMWGSRIFNEASTAAARREFRSTRRRLERRKERIKMLQSLMLDDMEKEYPNFFPMLKETSNTIEDKIQPFSSCRIIYFQSKVIQIKIIMINFQLFII